MYKILNSTKPGGRSDPPAWCVEEDMKERNLAEKIAYLVREQGGRAYYVGGCVRDRLLGIESKDVDLEIHGVPAECLPGILRGAGEPRAFGRSFGIYSLEGASLDIALPRTERPTGRGHRDFAVAVDPWLGPEQAAGRRDFTINALMEDVLTGEILDFYGGRRDLRSGTLRHVDQSAFGEDPLRVLRAAQFAARFGFVIAPETVELCREIDLSSLSRERVEEELKKALLRGGRPSLFFEALRRMEQTAVWFPEVRALSGVPQDPKFHPEGDVWVHTMEVLDRAASLREEAEFPYGFMMLALTHDFGKVEATELVNGRIHAYGHETLGLPRAETFVTRLSSDKTLLAYVRNMVPLHMKPNILAYSKASVKKTNRMFDDAAAPRDLILFAQADRPVISGGESFSGDPAFLRERHALYQEMMKRPYVKGEDLLAAGLEPGTWFSELLAYARKLRLAGIDRDSALKQVLSYAAGLQKEKR